MAPSSNSCSEAIWAASFSFRAHEDSPPGGKLLSSMLLGTRRKELHLRGLLDLIKWTDWSTLSLCRENSQEVQIYLHDAAASIAIPSLRAGPDDCGATAAD